ncbi:MAG: alpha/beta hydrolase [Myxococcota bacterium]
MSVGALLLPGLDGGRTLLHPFARALSPNAEVLPYPDEPLGYDDLEQLVRTRLAQTSATVLIAESFSGPLAIRIAATPPPSLTHVVLVATFARAPMSPRIAPLLSLAFAAPPPKALIRALMVGPDASNELVAHVQAAIRQTAPRTLRARAKEALRVDVRKAMNAIRIPALYLQPTQDRLLRPLPLPAGKNWSHVAIPAPHLLLQTRPEACAAAILRFANV